MGRKALKQFSSSIVGLDWSSLPEELLTIISEKATTTNLQYLHLRMVCKSWRRALISNPHHLPLQSPWILAGRTDIGDNCRLSFYDLSKCKARHIELSDMSGKVIYGSYYGWIVLVRQEKVTLHNPITGSFIELPSLDASPTNLFLAVSKDEGESSVSPIYQGYVKKVVLSCNPVIRGCIVVVSLLSPTNWELGFCRIGDTHWTGLKKRENGRSLLDISYGNNSVYAVNNENEVLAYDLTSLALRTFPCKINYDRVTDRINLVEGDARSDGPLMVISTGCLGRIYCIYVYEWINYLKQWRRVKHIGNGVLLLSRHNCFQLQLEDQKQNEIYYGVAYPHHSILSFQVVINKVIMEANRMVLHNAIRTEVFHTTYIFLDIWFSPSLM